MERPTNGQRLGTPEADPVHRFRLPILLVLGGLAAGILGAILWQGGFIGDRDAIREEVGNTITDANELFWVTRDYDAAIRKLENVLDEARLAGPDMECSAMLELASKNLRFSQEEAMRMYAEIYNDNTFGNECRAAALSDAMWHVASHIGDGSVDPEFVRTHVFAPGRFEEIISVTTPLKTSNDVHRATVLGFGRSYQLHPSHISGMSVARYIAAYYPKDRSLWDKNAEYAQKMHAAYKHALPLLENAVAESVAENVYKTGVIYALYNRVMTLTHLALVDLVPVSDVYTAVDEVFRYEEQFHNAAFSAPIFSAQAAYRYACAAGLLESRPLSEVRKQAIRGALGHIYTLSDEDLARRWAIAALSDQMTNMCREPIVYMANNVDPRLKGVLIEKIGRWTEEDFR